MLHVFEIRDGLIAHENTWFDSAAVARQVESWKAARTERLRGADMLDDAALQALLDRYFASDQDETVDTDLYHEDAILEFPQSGERYEGLANFLEWRRQYPAEVAYRVRRVMRRGDLVVIELTIAYDGGAPKLGVSIMDFRGDKVAREHIYVMDGWEPAEWRTPWRAEPPEVDDFAGFSSAGTFQGGQGADDLLDDARLRAALQRHWDSSGKDEDAAGEIYHEDAILEFPQSGERFEGLANFREWRRIYPAEIAFQIRRINRSDDVVATEYAISYDGGPWMFCVNVMEFRGERVAREHIYITEGWAAPEWRVRWRARPPEVDDAGGI